MFLVKLAIIALLFQVTLGIEFYELDAISKATQNKRELNQQPFDYMNRIVRDPGWRHIGLGKRASRTVMSMSPERTWSMMGLGR